MKTTLNTTGLEAALSGIENIENLADNLVADVIEEWAFTTHMYAVDGVSGGPATGRTYQKYQPSRVHKASAPGEYPMTDTGRLVASIKIEQEGPLVAYVGTAVDYGAHLEFGTSQMAARPWLMPSFEKATVDMRRVVEEMASKL